jgi:hypothetical protein
MVVQFNLGGPVLYPLGSSSGRALACEARDEVSSTSLRTNLLFLGISYKGLLSPTFNRTDVGSTPTIHTNFSAVIAKWTKALTWYVSGINFLLRFKS